ncbi:hypothetical protein [Niallia circulans]|uniref:Uncharacterized protein n=1 Tax=Niallia circulans TaxID=1397 RepID=A0A941G8J5_NIACI|nr:hypothetical protein [Niallia circulans]MCB5235526.1 hypothetical protein [Niallia circulans]
MKQNKEEKLEKALKELVKYAENKGLWPSVREWDKYAEENDLFKMATITLYTKKKSSELMKHYGFRNDPYTKEDCIESLKKCAETLGSSFSRYEYNKWAEQREGSLPTAAQISTRCASFNLAKIEAGLIPNHQGGFSFSDKELVSWVKKCYEDLGQKFSEDEYRNWSKKQDGAPNVETIRKRLGSLVKLKKSLQIDTFESGGEKIYTEDNIKPEFYRFLKEQLHINNYEKWAKENNAPALKTVIKLSGGYEPLLLEMLEIYIERIMEYRQR